jgi:molecular chaperone HtpG
MEINPKNAIIANLREKYAPDSTDSKDNTLKDIVWMLYETALLTSGFTLEEPTVFTKRIHKLIHLGLSIEEDTETDLKEDVIDISLNEEVLPDSTMEEVD